MARKPRNPPDYALRALNKRTDEKTLKLGVAWNNPDGSLTLVLNRFTVLPTDPEWVLTLFPATKQNMVETEN